MTVQAWFQNESCEDCREDNHFDPPRFISLEQLKDTSGVEYFKVNAENLKCANEYWQLRKDRGYDYEDLVELSEKVMKKEDLEAKLKIFYSEHLHDDEEIRLFLEGSGYFDVRDKEDNWIRIHASKGDLLILPAGIYHRFILDKNGFAKVQRLFCGNPVWTAKFRPEADQEPIRKEYINSLLKNAA